MSKVLNTTKDKLVQLLNVTDAVPAGKLATDISKHLGFRKAVKKHLKEYTDERAEGIEKVRAKNKEVQDKIRLLDSQIAEAPEDQKGDLVVEKDKLTREINNFVEEANTELNQKFEDLKLKKVEVTFDNEEFLFEKNVITDNATVIFKAGNDKFNADLAELIFDLLDSVK